jgi:hypothetical protein
MALKGLRMLDSRPETTARFPPWAASRSDSFPPSIQGLVEIDEKTTSKSLKINKLYLNAIFPKKLSSTQGQV